MCDTWVALSDATHTKQVIVGKNSDRPIFDCQPLLFHPRTTCLVWVASLRATPGIAH